MDDAGQTVGNRHHPFGGDGIQGTAGLGRQLGQLPGQRVQGLQEQPAAVSRHLGGQLSGGFQQRGSLG